MTSCKGPQDKAARPRSYPDISSPISELANGTGTCGCMMMVEQSDKRAQGGERDLLHRNNLCANNPNFFLNHVQAKKKKNPHWISLCFMFNENWAKWLFSIWLNLESARLLHHWESSQWISAFPWLICLLFFASPETAFDLKVKFAFCRSDSLFCGSALSIWSKARKANEIHYVLQRDDSMVLTFPCFFLSVVPLQSMKSPLGKRAPHINLKGLTA